MRDMDFKKSESMNLQRKSKKKNRGREDYEQELFDTL